MWVELTTRNVDMTPTVDKRIKKLVSKLEKLLDDSAAAHVILSAVKHRHRTDIAINWHDYRFTGIAETDDLESSVIQAIDKINRQALKQKEKFAARRRNTRKAAGKATTPETIATPEPRIIRSQGKVVKPLALEEAALHLSQSEDQFLVFRDADRNTVAVLFKRKDGNYGLIEP